MPSEWWLAQQMEMESGGRPVGAGAASAGCGGRSLLSCSASVCCTVTLDCACVRATSDVDATDLRWRIKILRDDVFRGRIAGWWMRRRVTIESAN
jgi:hypothetical protein